MVADPQATVMLEVAENAATGAVVVVTVVVLFLTQPA